MVNSFSPSTAVVKIFSPAIAGEELPGGSGVFHTTLLSGPNSIGRFVSSDVPDALGPRNWGQSAATHSPDIAIAANAGRYPCLV
jgi:hypothetical protein